MISRLRYQQTPARERVWPSVPQYRFLPADGLSHASYRQFQKDQIQPASEFEAHLVKAAHHAEP
jgi:hypothetical protein